MTRFALVLCAALAAAGCDAAAPAAPAAGPNAVQIVVRTTPPGGNVLVDGQPAGPSPATVKLNPGPHRIKAVMSGYYPAADTKIQVGQGEPTEHMLTLIASH
jgi:hypothetical protein